MKPLRDLIRTKRPEPAVTPMAEEQVFPWTGPHTRENPENPGPGDDRIKTQRPFTLPGSISGIGYFDKGGKLVGVRAVHGGTTLNIGVQSKIMIVPREGGLTTRSMDVTSLDIRASDKDKAHIIGQRLGDETTMSPNMYGLDRRRLAEASRLFKEVGMPVLSGLGVKSIESVTPNEILARHLERHLGAKVFPYEPATPEEALRFSNIRTTYDGYAENRLVDPRFKAKEQWHKVRIALEPHQATKRPEPHHR